MAKVIVRPSNICANKIFEGTMKFKDLEDMIKKVGEVESQIKVRKPSRDYTFSNNIHYIHFYKDGVVYDINLTYKQFKKMLPIFNDMGTVKIEEAFWLR